jgi:hypothetical protein
MECELLKFSNPNRFGGRPAQLGSIQFDVRKGISGIFLGYAGETKVVIRNAELEMLKRILFNGEFVENPDDKIKEEMSHYQKQGTWKKLWKNVFS